MEPVFAAIIEETKAKRDAVLATVVKTWGSTPQKAGAKLLVKADGSGVGTLGGGCVEGDIWFAARQLLQRGGSAEVKDYALNEELAAQDGLVCGGTMRFLIDQVPVTSASERFAHEAFAAYHGGSPVAIVLIVVAGKRDNGAKDTELHIGRSMLVRENGDTMGGLGDSELDRRAMRKAHELMAMGKSEYVEDSAVGCEYFVETFTTPPTVVVAGGGHVSKAIAAASKLVGMRFSVFDDREEFANRERFPEAYMVQTGEYKNGFGGMNVTPNSFIVIATRGHRHDTDATEAALHTPASYVGLLGSRRKTILVFEELLRRGIPIDELRRVKSPIGLDVGGRTPEEIAISIVAEILAFRLGGKGGPLTLGENLLKKAQDRARKPQRTAAISHN